MNGKPPVVSVYSSGANYRGRLWGEQVIQESGLREVGSLEVLLLVLVEGLPERNHLGVGDGLVGGGEELLECLERVHHDGSLGLMV